MMKGKVILETIVGSTLHGTSVDDGLEDLDLMAIMVENGETFVGFGGTDVATERTKPEGVRSEAGDVDRVIYGLKKYLGLALKSNPTILLPLFAPTSAVKVMTPEGDQLRKLAPFIISKRAYEPFRGYMVQQFERLKGTRGQMRVTRPELIERYGYDTKYAGHIVRLGLQGIELLRTGRLSLPMREADRTRVVDVRTGKYTFEEIEQMVPMLQTLLAQALSYSSLPDEPNFDVVNRWMINTYLLSWEHTDGVV